jgi:hypothetical protein
MSISIEKLIITRLFLQNQQNKCISYNVSWMALYIGKQVFNLNEEERKY